MNIIRNEKKLKGKHHENKSILSIRRRCHRPIKLNRKLRFILLDKELKEPIFLKHHHELSASLGTTIELHYITNRNIDQETDIAWGYIPGTDTTAAASVPIHRRYL